MLNYNKIPVKLHISSITGQVISSHECYSRDYHSSPGKFRRHSDLQVWLDSVSTWQIKETRLRTGKSSKQNNYVEKILSASSDKL